MAEVINALFEAKETISQALEKAEQAVESLDGQSSDLARTFYDTKQATDGAEDELEEFNQGAKDVYDQLNTLKSNLKTTQQRFDRLGDAESTTDQDTKEFISQLEKLSGTSSITDESLSKLRNELVKIQDASDGGKDEIIQLATAVSGLDDESDEADNAIGDLSQVLATLKEVEDSVEDSTNDATESMQAFESNLPITDVQGLNNVLRQTSNKTSEVSRDTTSLAGSTSKAIEELQDMRNASLNIEKALDKLSTQFTEADERGDLLRDSLSELQRENEATTVAVRNLKRNFDDINRVMGEYERGNLSADEATEQLRREFTDLSSSVSRADGMLGILQRTMEDVTDSGRVTTATGESLENQIGDIGRVSQTTASNIDSLANGMARVSIAEEKAESSTDNFTGGLYRAEKATEDLTGTTISLRQGVDVAAEKVTGLRNDLIGVTNASDVAGFSAKEFAGEAVKVSTATTKAADNVNEMSRSVGTLSATQNYAKGSSNQFARSISRASTATSKLIGTSAMATFATRNLASSLDEIGDQADDATVSAISLSGALATLSALSETSALEFGSLSVNIGPFNLALRNFITQVPAILTGMGSMIAVVGALIVAFTTLAAVTGALVVGGALAFFEEFSQQFEETGEAVEALGAALKDLFTEALAPIMNEANMDLFKNAVTETAVLVNRFAQFVEQMRSRVLSAVGQMSGDIDDFFNAMQLTFVALEPVIIGLINFILQDLPKVMAVFASLTNTVSGDLSTLISGFGALMAQLLDTASVILSGLTPVIVIALDVLYLFFALLNKMPSALVSVAITSLVLLAAIAKLTLSLVGLGTAISGVTGKMAAQAGTGSFLGFMYETLTGAALRYTNSQTTLFGAIKAVIAGIYGEIVALKNNTISKITNSLAADVLRTSYIGLIGMITAAIGAFTTEAGALTLSSVALGIYNTLIGIATKLTAAFTFVVGGLVSIIGVLPLVILAALSALVLLAQYFTDVDIFAPIINGAKSAINAIRELIGMVNIVPGMGDMGMNADIDDIETERNVDLSFEDNLEQNVDVQADPEEKAQLSRITKDAIEEANSFSRRRQGGQ